MSNTEVRHVVQCSSCKSKFTAWPEAIYHNGEGGYMKHPDGGNCPNCGAGRPSLVSI